MLQVVSTYKSSFLWMCGLVFCQTIKICFKKQWIKYSLILLIISKYFGNIIEQASCETSYGYYINGSHLLNPFHIDLFSKYKKSNQNIIVWEKAI